MSGESLPAPSLLVGAEVQSLRLSLEDSGQGAPRGEHTGKTHKPQSRNVHSKVLLTEAPFGSH